MLYLLSNISVIVLLLKAFDEMQTTTMSGAEATADSIASALMLMLSLLQYGVFNAYSIVLTIVNTVRIKREKEVRYFPGFAFIKT